MPLEKPLLLYSGRISIYRYSNVILRVGCSEDIAQEREGILRSSHLGLSPQIHKRTDAFFDDLDVLSESYLGEVADEVTRSKLVLQWLDKRVFEEQDEVHATLLQCLKQINPPMKIDVKNTIKIIRSHCEEEHQLNKKKLERILRRKISVVWHQGLIHGGLIERRIRQNGFCCWRHSIPNGLRGQDVAPYISLDTLSEFPMDILLHVLKWHWKYRPHKIPFILDKMQLIENKQTEKIAINVRAHPKMSSQDLATILDCSVDEKISVFEARRAIWRSKRVVVAGQNIEVKASGFLQGKKDPRFLQKRNRKERDLFSRFHLGIKLDDVGRYSLTPEKEALYIASKISKSIVLDAFGGCGGNAIAFARMKNIQKVFCCEIDRDRLSMAKHNASIYEISSKIIFVLGDCTLKKWSVDATIFLDPPWEAGMEQMQKWLMWAKENFQSGIAKLPKEFYLSNDEHFELIFSPEGYPRYMLYSW